MELNVTKNFLDGMSSQHRTLAQHPPKNVMWFLSSRYSEHRDMNLLTIAF